MADKKRFKWVSYGGALILFIWLSGAFIDAIHTTMQNRMQCITRDGLFKGLFWCPGKYGDSPDSYLLHSLLWPLRIISSTDAIEKSERNTSISVSQAEFDQSIIGTIYVCKGIASQTNRKKDLDTFSFLLEKILKEDMEQHAKDSSFTALANKQISEFSMAGNLERFYLSECEEQAKNIRRASV